MQFRNWQDAQRSGVNVVIGRTNPRKPDELEYEDGALNYLWPITPQENERVVELLEVADPEFEAPSVWVIVPQYNCTGCGKLAGFADSVYTALVDGVHSKSFMIKALQGKLTNKQPPRWVKYACSIFVFEG